MNNRLAFLFLAFLLIALGNSCGEDEDPLVENEEEVITSVTLTLFPNGPQEQVTLGFSDPDGDGGNDPVFSTTGTLRANSNYRAMVSFGNAEGAIDGEIVEEGLEHQVFYQVSGVDVDFAYDDSDVVGQPIGLLTTVNTGAAGNGTIIVTLRHEPNKAGAVIDNPTAAGGSTDVEVMFAVQIQ